MVNWKDIKKYGKIILSLITVVVSIIAIIEFVPQVNSYLRPIDIYPTEIVVNCNEWGKIYDLVIKNRGNTPLYDVNIISVIESNNYTFNDFNIRSISNSNEKSEIFSELEGNKVIIQYIFNATNGFPCIQDVISFLDSNEVVRLKVSYQKDVCDNKNKIKFYVAHYSKDNPGMVKKDSLSGMKFQVYCNVKNVSSYNIHSVELFNK